MMATVRKTTVRTKTVVPREVAASAPAESIVYYKDQEVNKNVDMESGFSRQQVLGGV